MQQYQGLICAVLRGEKVSAVPDVEGADFFQSCIQHGVALLVYYRIRQSGDEQQWPAALLARLQHLTLQSSATEQIRINELQRILGVCHEQGVYPLLLKGAALSYTHYPAPWLRPRCDTDLFVGFADLEPMREVMASCGYSVEFPIYKSHQMACCKGGPESFPHSFDIHWRINNAARFARVLSHEEALRQSVPVPQVVGAKTLCPVHALLLACVHLGANLMHDENRLLWLYDIHLLLSAMPAGELARFADLAVDRQVQDVCLAALEKSRRRFHTQVPEEVVRALAVSLRKLTPAGRFAQSNFGLLCNDLVVLPRFGQKTALLRELFSPPAGYLLRRYNKRCTAWLPLLYLQYVMSGVLKRLTLR